MAAQKVAALRCGGGEAGVRAAAQSGAVRVSRGSDNVDYIARTVQEMVRQIMMPLPRGASASAVTPAR